MCAKMTVQGTMTRASLAPDFVGPDDVAIGKEALFARHPEMRTWPAGVYLFHAHPPSYFCYPVVVSLCDQRACAHAHMSKRHHNQHCFRACLARRRSDHGFEVYELKIEDIWMIDFYGGGGAVQPNEYYSNEPVHNVPKWPPAKIHRSTSEVVSGFCHATCLCENPKRGHPEYRSMPCA